MLEHVFKPLQLGKMTLPNRFVVPAMVSFICGEDGKANDAFIAYHTEKAIGGWGMIITEDYAIDPKGRGYKNIAGLWCDEQIPSHRRLTESIHRHGAKIIAQIYHCGRQTTASVIGEAPLAPSAIPDPTSTEMPREMTIAEIEEVIRQFGCSAKRAEEAGFDGIEIHGGHGYLVSQFLSPYSNKRIDLYGGSFMNRLRFATYVIKEIRANVSEDFIVGFRISGDEQMFGARTVEDTMALLPALEEAGISYIHVSAGVYGSHSIIPSGYVPHAWIADFAGNVKKIAKVPVITVGRINDPFLADEIIASGRADLVAMGRASLADPHLPAKAKNGQYEDIRRCVGCNVGCQGNLYKGLPFTCTINPTLGLVWEQPVTDSPKKIIVIGAGPAGLSAALSAARKGHSVSVYEKTDRAGGQFRLASIPPGKGEYADYIRWLLTQLEKKNVPIHFNCETDAAAILEKKPDVVILAFGSVPVRPAIPGIDGENVITAQALLDGQYFPKRNCVVIGGGQTGAETASYLAEIGRSVTIVEALSQIAPNEEAFNRLDLLTFLNKCGVRMMTETTVTKITADHIEIMKDGVSGTIPADTVVLAVGSKPRKSSLEKELFEKGIDIRCIGDAKKAGQGIDAIHEGFWLGNSI